MQRLSSSSRRRRASARCAAAVSGPAVSVSRVSSRQMVSTQASATTATAAMQTTTLRRTAPARSKRGTAGPIADHARTFMQNAAPRRAGFRVLRQRRGSTSLASCTPGGRGPGSRRAFRRRRLGPLRTPPLKLRHPLLSDARSPLVVGILACACLDAVGGCAGWPDSAPQNQTYVVLKNDYPASVASPLIIYDAYWLNISFAGSPNRLGGIIRPAARHPHLGRCRVCRARTGLGCVEREAARLAHRFAVPLHLRARARRHAIDCGRRRRVCGKLRRRGLAHSGAGGVLDRDRVRRRFRRLHLRRIHLHGDGGRRRWRWRRRC